MLGKRFLPRESVSGSAARLLQGLGPEGSSRPLGTHPRGTRSSSDLTVSAAGDSYARLHPASSRDLVLPTKSDRDNEQSQLWPERARSKPQLVALARLLPLSGPVPLCSEISWGRAVANHAQSTSSSNFLVPKVQLSNLVGLWPHVFKPWEEMPAQKAGFLRCPLSHREKPLKESVPRDLLFLPTWTLPGRRLLRLVIFHAAPGS